MIYLIEFKFLWFFFFKIKGIDDVLINWVKLGRNLIVRNVLNIGFIVEFRVRGVFLEKLDGVMWFIFWC